ncbi:hypothetical protein ERJ75_000331400 [Trypanosoma vivax]|uniref:Putative RNA editing complex protein n=1 Tax=Trypanosoma vivax (strain Y486) TaxID=1055687 RepID=G0UAI8_TRYVY|nr:putative RNA editing complex protein [Trypanosoma vivax]KAH8617902.1 hypothetical protein ERJ75_000331400 [Trypanosoma vivax]CCC52821.1 putative RNA editing complex protein [Trypanosoma vivax Y486]
MVSRFSHTVVRRPLLHLMATGRGNSASLIAAACTTVRHHTCLLCDAQYESWGEHSTSAAHIARHAICKTFASPERHNAVMQQLWKHIRLDFGYIDDVTHKKEDRRRRRLASTMRHLREKGVLCHGLPRVEVAMGEDKDASVTLAVTENKFLNYMLLGESYARQEAIDRVARLMPQIDAIELSSVARYVLSKRRLAYFFDVLEMQQMLLCDPPPQNTVETPPSFAGDGKAIPPPRLRQDEKAVVIFSCLGELQAFSRQERSHSVATRAAAEQLVLNVLCTHVMENLVAELVHEALQNVVEEGTPVWRTHCKELKNKLFEGTRTVPPPLADSPSPVGSEKGRELDNGQLVTDLYELYALDSGDNTEVFTPPSRRQSWHDVTRALAFETTVPNPINKSAAFAPTMPKLVSRKK